MEKARQKETIIVIGAGFLVLFFIFDKEWMSFVSLGVLLVGIISDALTAWIHTAWFWIAEKLGWVMSKVILGITFLLILVPVGALSKVFRKDMMMLKKRKDSYYRERDHVYEAGDMRDPW
jgi:hypothetical protein